MVVGPMLGPPSRPTSEAHENSPDGFLEASSLRLSTLSYYLLLARVRFRQPASVRGFIADFHTDTIIHGILNK